MKGHIYWQAWHHFLFPVDVLTEPEYTLTRIPRCVCSEWLCVGMLVESRPGVCFFMLFWERQTFLFYFREWICIFFCLPLLARPSSVPKLCSTKMKSCQAGLSGSEMWSAAHQPSRKFLRLFNLLPSMNPVDVHLVYLCFFLQSDEVRCGLHMHMKVNLHFQYFIAACECVYICFVKAVRSRW